MQAKRQLGVAALAEKERALIQHPCQGGFSRRAS
jgi:hypothetical protein